MKDLHKNPNLYYILIPVFIALWPLMLKTAYIPKATKMVEDQKNDYMSAQPVIYEILEIDPDRLKFADVNDLQAEFDYAVVIDKVADQCRISESSRKLTQRPSPKQSGKKTKQATLDISQIDIETMSKFISTMLDNWSDLECEDIKITHKVGLKDKWDVQIRLKYTANGR